MPSQRWYQSWRIVVLGTIAIAAVIVGSLHFFIGLRFELDGSSMRPLISLHDPEAHLRTLEQNRAGQRALLESAPTAEDLLPSRKGAVRGAGAEASSSAEATEAVPGQSGSAEPSINQG